MATDKGTLFLDVKSKVYTFGSSPKTLMLVENRDYENKGFEMYTHTPIRTVPDFKTYTQKRIPKTIIPEFIAINEGNLKKINTKEFFRTDRLKRVEVYFCKDAIPDKALIVGFVTENLVKSYYTTREINEGTTKDVEISSFRLIKEGNLLEELYKENYTKNKVLTIKVDTTSSYHNVEVTKDQNISGGKEFHKYIHKPNERATSFTNMVLDRKSKSTFNSFKPGDYSNDKLEHVSLYFHNNDSSNTLPLLIELKPKSGKQLGSDGKDTKVYYELKTLVEKKLDDDRREWERTYEKGDSVNNIGVKLNQIYSGNLKEKIDNILGISDNSTVIGAVSGTVGTISAIGTGVGGFFIYKNSALVITFLKSLF